ncbi:MAG: hypothetical protein U1F30_10670 [Steroidobacteraceae bacterium]
MPARAARGSPCWTRARPRSRCSRRPRADAPLWAHDGRRLAYARTREDGSSDVLIAEPAAGLGEGAAATAPWPPHRS